MESHHICKSAIPLQLAPSDVKPSRHEQIKLPFVLLHICLQGEMAPRHSSSSGYKEDKWLIINTITIFCFVVLLLFLLTYHHRKLHQYLVGSLGNNYSCLY